MIELENVTKLYKNRRGIRNISLSVNKGDIIGLLGPNGSGKTTIMKAMLGLIPYESGSIKINGMELSENTDKILSQVGALIESPAIYKDLSAYNNLKLSARNKNDINDIDRVLNVVHMDAYRNDKAGRFSLGMKQRLGLAAAFLGKPDIVILDEPVNGLDIEGVVEIRDYIKKMSLENGTTFIISSHIASEIEKLCTKTAVIYESELVSFDSTDHIMRLYPSMEDYFLEKIHERRGGI